MPRQIDERTLEDAGRYYAAQFTGGNEQRREWVMRQFFNFTYRDEHAFVLAAAKDFLGRKALPDFENMADRVFAPRDPAVFEKLLREKLAISVDGDHIEGRIGSSKVGERFIRFHDIEVETPDSLLYRRIMRRRGVIIPKADRETHVKTVPYYWPIYAGEGHERARSDGLGVADPLPEGTPGLPLGATTWSNESVIAALDAGLALIDEGTGAGIIRGSDGSQPAGPDTAFAGNQLFLCVGSDPFFNGATDDNPGAVAAADTIAADSSAGMTGTLTYCRISATNDGATPLDDHIDGAAGTSGQQFNLNTLSIVSGANVEFTSGSATLAET